MLYLYMVGQGVDKFKSWDPLVAAHHAYIFSVFAVWNTDPIGGTQCQGLFFASAVQIVEPDGSWRNKREVLSMLLWGEIFSFQSWKQQRKNRFLLKAMIFSPKVVQHLSWSSFPLLMVQISHGRSRNRVKSTYCVFIFLLCGTRWCLFEYIIYYTDLWMEKVLYMVMV